MAEDIRSFINDYNDLLRLHPEAQEDIKQIVKESSTDGEAQFKIRQLLQGLDNEGRAPKADSTYAMSKALNSWPDREDKIELPTTATVLKSLGYADDKDKNGNVVKTAQEQFVEDYLKKPKTMRDDLAEKKPQFGTKSEEILKRAFRESVYDIGEQQTKKRREEVINGTAEDSPWYDKLAGRVLLPAFGDRQREAYLRGEDPSLGDYAADVGGNMMMLVPSAKYVQLAGKVPGVAKVGQLASTKLSPVASKLGASLFGNTVAPVGSEVFQYAGDVMGNAPESELNISPIGNVDVQYSDQPNKVREPKFNSSRAILGSLANFGVNDILLRGAGKAGRVLFDTETAGQIKKQARQALKGAANDVTAKDYAQAYVVNKMGGKKAADYAAASLHLDPKLIKDLRTNAQEVDDARYYDAEDERNRILDAAQSAQDEKYLKMILDDPEIINKSNDTGFRMWFVTRGNDLLRGTTVHVPTLEVK